MPDVGLEASWHAADRWHRSAVAVTQARDVARAEDAVAANLADRYRVGHDLARRILAVKSGEVQFLDRCQHCRSTQLSNGLDGGLECVQCGRESQHSVVRRDRRGRIREYIERGVS